MHIHEPRPVDRAAPWRWAREAAALMARRPLTYSLSSIVALVFFFAAMQIDSLVLRFALVLLLPPMALMGYIRLAQAADQSLTLSAVALLPNNRDAGRVLGIAVAGYGLAFAALSLMTAAGTALEPLPIADPQALHERWQRYLAVAGGFLGVPTTVLLKLALFGVSITAFCGILLGLFSWFTLPIVQFAGLSLLPATLLSLRAYRINIRPLGLMGAILFVFTVATLLLTMGVAALMAAPFVGALLYVSYRDVFLGRAENAPVVVKVEGALGSYA